MPHADSSFVPSEITTRSAFYEHVAEQLEALLDGSTYWVSNLAQASSLLYHAYLSSPLYGSDQPPSDSSPHSPTQPPQPPQPVVNWVGFYLQHPRPSRAGAAASAGAGAGAVAGAGVGAAAPAPLVVGPYNGRPACISIAPVAGRGVCADAFVKEQGVVVRDVEEYPGHIACDGDTRSEIVLPLRTSSGRVIGVLDLDSTRLATFGGDDLEGLSRVVDILARGCDWE
ncbi:hypothetical protein EHS25_010030 [Saitozyma podzolica]|uniref:GAF domain-containing protein n=1 Tax=Saitozyma podzolica TaxID=1890683 RepID=A0A427YID8_9TREE|nr:hypothetical protein EHS25_010030 [Saitozyma podzolica]